MRMNLGRMIGLGLTAYTMYKAYQKYQHPAPAGPPMAPATGMRPARSATGLRSIASRRRGAL